MHIRASRWKAQWKGEQKFRLERWKEKKIR